MSSSNRLPLSPIGATTVIPSIRTHSFHHRQFDLPVVTSIDWIRMEKNLSDLELHWCKQLLHDPEYVQLQVANRRPPPPLNKMVPNTMFSQTLRTDDTTRSWTVLKGQNPVPGKVSPELLILFSLGTAVGGFKDTAHGGFASLMMDQAINMCATLVLGASRVTAESWQKYRKPIPLPGVYLCRAVCSGVDGVRTHMESSIEDGSGTVYTQGNALLFPAPTRRATSKM